MTTWYVRASGLNSNAGTSFGAAFQTINHALNASGAGNGALAAGDTVILCADSEHIMTAPAALTTSSGTRSALIRVVAGRAVDGVEDLSARVVVRPTTGALSSLITNGTGTVTDMLFKNIDFDGRDIVGTRRATRLLDTAVVNTSTRWRFINCNFGYAINDNIRLRGSLFNFYKGSTHNAGGMGIALNSTSDSWGAIDFEAFDNASHGFDIGINVTQEMKRLRSYRNGGDGFRASSGGSNWNHSLADSVAYDNTGHGLTINHAATGSTPTGVVYNSTFVNNGGYGINFSNAAATDNLYLLALMSFLGNNHAHGNTSGAHNIPAVAWSDLHIGGEQGGLNIIGDPLFVDAANGDFALQAGSPLVGAGLNGSDIGPNKYTAGGSGGSDKMAAVYGF